LHVQDGEKIMVFGKKESIFDADQNKQLQALVKNQAVLIKNNNYFVKEGKDQWGWINKLSNENRAQDAFDKTVNTTIEGLKVHSHPDLAKQIQDLEKLVAQLQQNIEGLNEKGE